MHTSVVLVATLLLAPSAAPSSDKAAPKPAVQGSPCDPYTQGSWAARAPFPLAASVRGWGTYFPDNGRFYVMGGRTSDGLNSDLLNPREYDPIGNVWATKAASFADGQVNNMVGGVLNVGGSNRIVVVGGSAATFTTSTADVRHYDPIGDVMTTITTDPWPGAGGGTTLPGGGAVFNNKLYVLGGYVINTGTSTAIWEYDPNAAPGGRWTLKTAVLPIGLGYIPTATSGSFIYLMGGSTFTPPATLADTSSSLRYDPTLDVVTPTSPIPRVTAETRAVTQPSDGSIWVLGGGRTTPNPSAQVDVYRPGLDSWITAPALLTARRNFAADFDPATGRVWTVGGYNAGNAPQLVNEQFECVVPVELMGFSVE
jgi:hypothetical protein